MLALSSAIAVVVPSRPAWLAKSVAGIIMLASPSSAAVVMPSRPAWLTKSVAEISLSTGPLGANAFVAELKASYTCTNKHTGDHESKHVQGRKSCDACVCTRACPATTRKPSSLASLRLTPERAVKQFQASACNTNAHATAHNMWTVIS